MTENWVTNLDMLAANGVLDYDGAAYLRGTPPRYIGNPALRTYPQPLPPTNVTLPQAPAQDTFTPADKPLIENPSWKKVLFALVGGATLIYSAIKLKGTKPIKWIGKQLNNLWNWVKKPFSKTRKP